MPKLNNKKDRDRSKTAVEFSADSIKLEDGNNLILILDPDYEEGYSHWVEIANKNSRHVCLSDVEDGGWDPENCPGCKLTEDLYAVKKQMKSDGDKVLEKEYGDKAYGVKGKYSAIFKAIRFGSEIQVETVKGKDGKKKKKRSLVANYEEKRIGKLNLGFTANNKLLSFIEDEENEVDGDNIIGYILNFKKEKIGNKTYTELSSIKIAHVFDESEVEIDESDVPDISKEFEVDEDSLTERCEAFRAEELDMEEEFEEEELEKKTKTKKKKPPIKKASTKKTKKKKEEVIEEEEIEDDEDLDVLVDEEEAEEEFEGEEVEEEEEEEFEDEDF